MPKFGRVAVEVGAFAWASLPICFFFMCVCVFVCVVYAVSHCAAPERVDGGGTSSTEKKKRIAPKEKTKFFKNISARAQ